MSFKDKFENSNKRILPSPFTIAILLTMLTFLLALIFTKPTHVGYGSYCIDLLGKWENALWDDSKSGLYFAFQMMMMLLLGHVIALSKPVSKLIDYLTRPCTTTANTAFVVTLATIVVSLFNWGLGLIFGAILARKVGEKFSAANKPLNYALIGSSAYSGLIVWHLCLSGSAPLKAAEDGNLKNLVANVEGVDLSKIPDSIPMSEMTFSGMNIFVTCTIIILLPALMYFLGKRKFTAQKLPVVLVEANEHKEKPMGIERLDAGKIFSFSIGTIILFYAFYKAVILPETLSLSFLSPNFINFSLLGLCLIFHSSVNQFLTASDDAIKGTTGILLQFPLYFGIMGLMIGSGLINVMANYFVEISTPETYPIFTYFSAALVNVFVPSGGGQWAVQGPILIATAQELNLSYGKTIMALAYGDQLTNMIQPFWALPLLGITCLKAKEIIPYTLILMAVGFCIFLLAIFVF